MNLQGIEKILTYISIQGSIGSGKSTLLKHVIQYLEEHQLDASDPNHPIIEGRDYYLIVNEPLAKWEAEICIRDGRKISYLNEFYKDPEGMGFKFQIVTFVTRITELMESIEKIVESGNPRRIHIIAERSLRADNLFFQTVCQTNSNMEIDKSIYDTLYHLNCDKLNNREDMMIYLPTPPKTCKGRISMRDRKSETENTISEAYLSILDANHKSMVDAFERERGIGSVIRLEDFNNHLTENEISTIVRQTMITIGEFVKSR